MPTTNIYIYIYIYILQTKYTVNVKCNKENNICRFKKKGKVNIFKTNFLFYFTLCISLKMKVNLFIPVLNCAKPVNIF